MCGVRNWDDAWTISDFQKMIGEWRREKQFETGWKNIPEKLMLIVSEISEAMEDYRNGKILLEYENDKPIGLASELADTIIRILDLSDALGIDLQETIRIKMKYNETRPIKHGRKC